MVAFFWRSRTNPFCGSPDEEGKGKRWWNISLISCGIDFNLAGTSPQRPGPLQGRSCRLERRTVVAESAGWPRGRWPEKGRICVAKLEIFPFWFFTSHLNFNIYIVYHSFSSPKTGQIFGVSWPLLFFLLVCKQPTAGGSIFFFSWAW